MSVIFLGGQVIYTINNKIMFCERNGTLWSVNNPESQYVLTATAGRLLGFLLSKRGDIIIRDDILNTVWDSYGLRTSTHSLNKYISDLRRVFIKLGLEEEVIVTVPKVGFKITAAILIDNDDPFLDKDTSEQAASSEKIDSDHLVSKRTVHARSLYFLVNNIRGGMLFLVIIATIFAYFYLSKPNGEPASSNNEFYYVGNIDSCSVSSLVLLPDVHIRKSLSVVNEVMENHHLSCPKNGYIFFNVSDAVFYNKTGRVFLSICSKKGTDLSSCFSFYERFYEGK